MSEQRPPLILGSSSPRRRDLLDAVGLRYTVCKPETPEVPHPGEQPVAYARRNAEEKAIWVADWARASGRYAGGCLIISADTIVVLGDAILEKPRDSEHAAAMLRSLSGCAHTVISGVSLQAVGICGDRRSTFDVATQVRLKPLKAAEIAAYIRTGEPLDKAGAYAAQGIGSYMVERIEGSYANVVGLPVAQVIARLEQDFGYSLWE